MLSTLRTVTDTAPDGVTIRRTALLDTAHGAMYVISVRLGRDTVVWRYADVTMPDDATCEQVAYSLADFRAGMEAVCDDVRARVWDRCPPYSAS